MELNDRERQLVLVLIETLTLKAPDELVEVAMGLRKKLLSPNGVEDVTED